MEKGSGREMGERGQGLCVKMSETQYTDVWKFRWIVKQQQNKSNHDDDRILISSNIIVSMCQQLQPVRFWLLLLICMLSNTSSWSDFCQAVKAQQSWPDWPGTLLFCLLASLMNFRCCEEGIPGISVAREFAWSFGSGLNRWFPFPTYWRYYTLSESLRYSTSQVQAVADTQQEKQCLLVRYTDAKSLECKPGFGRLLLPSPILDLSLWLKICRQDLWNI